MNTKRIFKVLTLVLSIGLVATCSKSSDDGGSGTGNTVTSITLTGDTNAIESGQSVSFTVKDNLNNNVTADATLSINGSTISNPYTFNGEGDFNVIASYNSLTSNSVSISVEAPVTSITIASNVTSAILETQESFEITVTGNNDVDYSDSSIIYADGVAITGNVYTPTEIGTYEIYAKKDDLTSNTLDLECISGVNNIFVSLSSSGIEINEEIEFTVVDNYDNDVTSESTFYVDGVAITGTKYSTTTSGLHEVYAVYTSLNGDLQSATSNFVVFRFTQKVLVEDYTGTWCGYCPRLAYKLEQAEQQNSSVIGVAIHNDDPMEYENEAQMRGQYGVTGLPAGRINRTITWNESLDQVIGYTEENQGLGLAINSSLSGDNVSADVKIAYDVATSGNKLVVYLLEDGLIYPQVNYMNNDSSSPWFGAGDPIVGFVHNNVLRKSFTDIFGDAIPDGLALGEHTATFNLTIPSSVQDNSKMEIVAFVLNTFGTVVNVQHAAIGVNQDFD